MIFVDKPTATFPALFCYVRMDMKAVFLLPSRKCGSNLNCIELQHKANIYFIIYNIALQFDRERRSSQKPWKVMLYVKLMERYDDNSHC